ncbi:MAG TPA: glycerophosphodiester phosphodiesterase family protein [Candidatus Polarisedimenticolia bacterium]|nr:glycerophosphodiester phosphodiesterase family protein [Candidatus Polarisedimenticolia bacterium]
MSWATGPRPLRFAHRGASARAPENTLAAFEEAIRHGVDALELDVHLSADGVPVVMHDDTVDRTTNGHGAVSSLRLETLKRLDAGAWFDRRFRGERVPTLEETLDCARGRCGLNIEIKEPSSGRRRRSGSPASPRERSGAALAAAVARCLARSRFAGLLIVSSFAPAALIRARAAMPRARLGFLASRSSAGLLPLHRRVGLFALHPHARLASHGRISAAHQAGLAVFVWPVNDVPLMLRLVSLGADGLMTDDPALFSVLDRSAAPS